MTPTTDELRALVERLERAYAWRLFQEVGADDGLPERFDDAPYEAAAAIRLWIAERERGEQKSVKGRHWQAYIEEYELEHGKGSFDATGE